LNSIQKEFLDDEIIDVEREKECCARYGYGMVNETHLKRRRLLLGGLLGDESMEVLQAVGIEVYDVFHTVSFSRATRPTTCLLEIGNTMIQTNRLKS